MSKRLLFLGGGRSNIGAIKTAKSMGIECYIAGIAGDYPCNEYADKLIDINILDKHATYNAVKDLGLDGVLICCSDKALETCGYLCDKLNLPGISESAAVLSSNKYEMKRALINAGVNTAKFVKVSSKFDLDIALKELSFPLMVKAVDLQGSRGIYRAENEFELNTYYAQVCQDSSLDYCIVEECIIGIEMGAQAFVYKGEVLFVQPHGDIISRFGAISAPTGHYTPVDLQCSTEQAIFIQATKAIKALNLDNCAVNIDFIIREGIPYFLELTGRVGANCLPMMMSYHFGFDYYKMIVSAAVGDNPICHFKPKKSSNYTVTKMMVASQSGVVKSIEMPTSKMPYVSMFIKKGDCIHVYRCANDCIGEVLCQASILNDAISLLEEYNKNLKIGL